MNWWLKHVRSIKTEGVTTLTAKNWQTKYGALIACYQPQTRTIKVYEPVLLLNLVSIQVEQAEDEVTCIDVAQIGVVVGFRTGKCILYDLEDGSQKVTY
jgi:hypothetical protein